MHPVLFKIGSLTFYTHGVLAVVGIVVTSLIINYLAGKQELDRTYFFDNMIYTVLAGIVGARLTYFFLYRDQFASIKEILYLQDGGMVSYGGFVAGLIAYILIFRNQGKNLTKWLDLMAIAFPFGLFFGRIGNLMAGEYAGKLTNSRYQLGSVVPVTLNEAILVLLIGLMLYLVYKKRDKVLDGYYFPLLLVLYGFGRFVIDYWRDEPVLFWHMNLGQITSLITAIIGVWLLLSWRKNNRKVQDGAF